MFFKSLELTNFRNYGKFSIKFNEHINIIVGKNGQGKTNIIESLYYLAYLKSHRISDDNILINNLNKKFKIKAKIKRETLLDEVQIEYSNNSKKMFFNSSEYVKNSDFLELINIILFEPNNLEIIKGSPSNRRDFLNDAISQINGNYYNVLNDFNRLLKMRNEYLKSNNYDQTYLDTLDKYYIEKALTIYQMRSKYISRLNEFIREIYKNIMGIDGLQIEYKSFYNNIKDKENMKELFEAEMKKNYSKEKYLGQTIEGPQKDDFIFLCDSSNLKEYGSQGQQRGAVISLKFAEAEILKKYKNITPIFLLDDVFSELDGIRKNNLIKYIQDGYQVILTTTDLTKISRKLIQDANIIKIDKGKVV